MASILKQLCLFLAIFGAVFADPLVDNIDYIIVIYEENWSFDAMFAAFPGANGYITNQTAFKNLNPQTDKNGNVYTYLPPPPNFAFPTNLPNMPFEITPIVNDSLVQFPDPTHKFYEEQYMINGGKMDRYVAWNAADGLSLAWWNSTDEYMGQLAQEYSLFDNFFHSAFGPSLLNHYWLACACSPKWESDVPPPSNIVAVIDPITGFYNNTSSPLITPDMYVIGTISPSIPPIDPSFPTNELVPPISNPTIGDQLNDAGVSWAYFQDGYSDAINGHPSPHFEYNHNPYLYFKNYANGTELRARHMRDTTEFLANLSSGAIPHVSFIKPMQPNNFHPANSDRYESQMYLRNMINTIKASPIWKRALVVVTFDEHGGFFDHVAPPTYDRWGPGSRVPCIVISPFAKKGHVDHTETETLSVLKTIQRRYNLPNLGIRQAKNDITSSLEFPTPIASSAHAVVASMFGLVVLVFCALL